MLNADFSGLSIKIKIKTKFLLECTYIFIYFYCNAQAFGADGRYPHCYRREGVQDRECSVPSDGEFIVVRNKRILGCTGYCFAVHPTGYPVWPKSVFSFTYKVCIYKKNTCFHFWTFITFSAKVEGLWAMFIQSMLQKLSGIRPDTKKGIRSLLYSTVLISYHA